MVKTTKWNNDDEKEVSCFIAWNICAELANGLQFYLLASVLFSRAQRQLFVTGANNVMCVGSLEHFSAFVNVCKFFDIKKTQSLWRFFKIKYLMNILSKLKFDWKWAAWWAAKIHNIFMLCTRFMLKIPIWNWRINIVRAKRKYPAKKNMLIKSWLKFSI